MERPSGQQFVLTMAGASATITEVRAGLRALRIDGVEVLLRPARKAHPGHLGNASRAPSAS